METTSGNLILAAELKVQLKFEDNKETLDLQISPSR